MGEILDQKDQRGVKASLLKDLDLEQVLYLTRRAHTFSHTCQAA